MANSAPKAHRIFLIIPMLIAVLLLGGYTAFWFFGAGVMREEIDKFVSAEADLGRSVNYETRSIRGFPIALRAQIGEFTWNAEDKWNWSGETLHIVAMPFDPNRLILAPRGPQQLTSGDMEYALTPNNLSIGISETLYSAEGDELLLEREDGARVSLGHLKGDWQFLSPEEWAMKGIGHQITLQDAEGREAILPGVNIAMSQSPEDNGSFRIDAAEVAFDDGTDGAPTLLKVNGVIGVDNKGFPAGNLRIVYRDERKMLALLERFGLVTGSQVNQADQVLRALRAGQAEATISLTMRDGGLYNTTLIPFRIGSLPVVQ